MQQCRDRGLPELKVVSEPRRILVDHGGNKGIGDIVGETLLYPALRLRYPDAQLFSRHCRSLAWGNPYVDGFDTSSPERAFDRVIPTPRAPFGETLREALSEGRSVFDHYLRFCGLDSVGHPPELFVLPREMAQLGLEDDGGDDLIIALSTDSKEVDRRWGDERFQALARYLEQAHGASVVEIGSAHSSGHLGVGLDLVGQTTLRQSMAVLSLVDLFVGNHGGLTHLAGGVGTPILSPWGGSHPFLPYAYDELSVAVEVELPCRHCRWLGGGLPQCWVQDLESRVPCTQLISVERMIAEADALIPRIRERRTRLKAEKAARLQAARDPLALERFEVPSRVTVHTHSHCFFGGSATSPGEEHWTWRHDSFPSLVAFPDWFGAPDEWRSLLAAYVKHVGPNDPWVLMLSAHPLSGAEIQGCLEAYFQDELRLARPLPKIGIVLGPLTLEERQSLLEQAKGYFPLGGGPYRLPVEALPTGTRLLGIEQLVSLGPLK